MSENVENQNINDDISQDVIDECEETIEVIEETNETENEMQILQDKYNEMVDKYTRSLAEFDNFRKRTMKEKASMFDDGVRNTIEKLLPVIDNLERAVNSHAGKSEDDAFFTGVEMTLKQLQETLTSLNVETIKALGEKFDPNLHSAVAHEDNDEFGENEVVIEMLKGYKYKDKVIRHSMVKVAN